VKGVIIRFHSLHHLSASRRRPVLSGIYRFETAGDHRYPVTDPEAETRGVVASNPGRRCRDKHCFQCKVDGPETYIDS